jgi:hypothetical protein
MRVQVPACHIPLLLPIGKEAKSYGKRNVFSLLLLTRHRGPLRRRNVYPHLVPEHYMMSS